MWQLKNSKCEKTHKLKMWQLKNAKHEKTKQLTMWTKLKVRMWQLKNSKCDKTHSLKKKLSLNNIFCHYKKIVTTQKFKLWQNSENQIDAKLNFFKILISEEETNLFSKNKVTPRQQIKCCLGSVLLSCDVYCIILCLHSRLLPKQYFWYAIFFHEIL